ncbi:MAG: hypothetical protein M1814_006459 [Vezdaea aestivalis]|nr:MAG: hypothetical protein M1814_006459 [Vezdaea aestivalis]
MATGRTSPINLRRTRELLAELAEEGQSQLEKIEALPLVELQRDLRRITTQIQNLQTTLQTTVVSRLNRIDQNIASLNYSTRNNSARTHNSSLSHGYLALTPLVNVLDGQPIDHFPETADAIQSLTRTETILILRCLGATVLTGSTDVVRRRLRTEVGLKDSPA